MQQSPLARRVPIDLSTVNENTFVYLYLIYSYDKLNFAPIKKKTEFIPKNLLWNVKSHDPTVRIFNQK